MRRLRVLHLCGTSGSNSYFRCWADFGDRQRFDYRIATLEPEGPLHREMRDRGLPAFSLDATSRARKGRAILSLHSYLRAERIDVIQTHLLDAAWVGAVAGRLARTPLVVFTGHHSHEVSVVPSWRLRLADTVVARTLSHRILAHSEDMRQIFLRHEHIDPARIAIIPFPLERAAWRADPTRRQTMRAALGLEDKIVMGAAGRFYWVKDYPLLLRAFAQVASAEPRLALVIAGDGADRPRIEELIRHLKLVDRVHLVGHRADAAAVFSAFDLFVHAALAESFCQVVVEAFALGIPVVSSAVGIAPEIMADDVTGRLFRPGDEAGLVTALRAMLAQRERWPAMGEEGRRRVEPFSGAEIIPRFEAQFLTWISECRRSADSERGTVNS